MKLNAGGMHQISVTSELPRQPSEVTVTFRSRTLQNPNRMISKRRMELRSIRRRRKGWCQRTFGLTVKREHRSASSKSYTNVSSSQGTMFGWGPRRFRRCIVQTEGLIISRHTFMHRVTHLFSMSAEFNYHNVEDGCSMEDNYLTSH